MIYGKVFLMKIVGRLKQYVLRVVLLQVTVVGGFNAAHAQAENVEETEVKTQD